MFGGNCAILFSPCPSIALLGNIYIYIYIYIYITSASAQPIADTGYEGLNVYCTYKYTAANRSLKSDVYRANNLSPQAGSVGGGARHLMLLTLTNNAHG